eukprot:363858-Chlamydomonas_euryale.AAC.5
MIEGERSAAAANSARTWTGSGCGEAVRCRSGRMEVEGGGKQLWSAFDGGPGGRGTEGGGRLWVMGYGLWVWARD